MSQADIPLGQRDGSAGRRIASAGPTQSPRTGSAGSPRNGSCTPRACSANPHGAMSRSSKSAPNAGGRFNSPEFKLPPAGKPQYNNYTTDGSVVNGDPKHHNKRATTDTSEALACRLK